MNNSENLLITGGTPLKGRVRINGAKNAAIAIIPAALLVDGICRIENVPDIIDVRIITDILSQLGARIRFINKHTIEINSTGLTPCAAPYEMVSKMRASYYLLGSLLSRFHKASVALPGGCDFGVRPIDQHLKGFRHLGANIETVHGVIEATAEKLIGTNIYLDVVSVGATINIMLAATLADGLTVIENPAKEPHVVDVANFLTLMGAKISGAGTDTIKITGVERLHGGTYSIIPDQIEAGTFMIATAATGGDVFIDNVTPTHLQSISSKLIEMGVEVDEYDDSVRVRRTEPLKAISVKTLPYPGFATDLHPQMAVLLCMAEGTSTIFEGVWDNRFQYVPELRRLGANISVDGRTATIEGVPRLTGAQVEANDLRAGAALIVAGLAANGVTEVSNMHYVERGYENFAKKLFSLGAQVVKKGKFSTDNLQQIC